MLRPLARRALASAAAPPPSEQQAAAETRRQQRIKALKDEMHRGYFDDVAEMRRNQGKQFVAASTLAPAPGAIALPPIAGRDLRGADVDVAAHVHAHAASLVGFGFRQSARPMLATFMDPFRAEYGARRDVGVYEVAGVEGWLFGLMRGMIERAMQRQIPPEQHAQVVLRFGNAQPIRDTLLMKNPLIGHVYLVDREARVRWRAHSVARPDEVASMLALTKQLLAEQ